MPANKQIDSSKELLALTRRLNIIEGQIRGINKMVSDNVYCIDIMKQIKAAQNSLEKASFGGRITID